uniref:L antigen family member 3 n=1 Tax=Leptobrachium leishanense TaxID=445787 RepID=A0A8C5MTB7_9ANUR
MVLALALKMRLCLCCSLFLLRSMADTSLGSSGKSSLYMSVNRSAKGGPYSLHKDVRTPGICCYHRVGFSKVAFVTRRLGLSGCRSMVPALLPTSVMALPALHFQLRVPFPGPREAQIAHDSLCPDAEPRKGGVSKTLSVTDNVLQVRWQADEARILRVSVSSFLDHLSLVVQTMDRFGPPAVDS